MMSTIIGENNPRDAADEDVATMMRVLRSQLNTVMDITSHIEDNGVFKSFYSIPSLPTTDAIELYTLCNSLSARVNEKVWKKYEEAGLLKRMKDFFRRVANYKEKFVDAQLMEVPTEQLLSAGHAQDVLRNMLNIVNDQNADIQDLLKQRYEELQAFERKHPFDAVQQLVADLDAENNLLDEQLQIADINKA